MTETRSKKRRKTFAFFGVNDQNNNNFVGWIVDMTIEGFRLRSITKLDTDSNFQFKIELPFEIDGSHEILFEAKSIWSKKIEKKNEFNTGFTLHKISSMAL